MSPRVRALLLAAPASVVLLGVVLAPRRVDLLVLNGTDGAIVAGADGQVVALEPGEEERVAGLPAGGLDLRAHPAGDPAAEIELAATAPASLFEARPTYAWDVSGGHEHLWVRTRADDGSLRPARRLDPPGHVFRLADGAEVLTPAEATRRREAGEPIDASPAGAELPPPPTPGLAVDLTAAGLALGLVYLTGWAAWRLRRRRRSPPAEAPSPAGLRRLAARPEVGLFAVFALLALLLVPLGRLAPWVGTADAPALTAWDRDDEGEHLARLSALWRDGRLDTFGQDERLFARAWVTTPTGRGWQRAPLGPTVLWSPPWLGAHAASHLARDLGAPLVPDGVAAPYPVAVAAGSALALLLATALALWAARPFGTAPSALAAALLVGYASGLPALAFVRSRAEAGPAALALAAALWAWLRLRRREDAGPAACLGLGLLWGLAAVSDRGAAALLVGPLLDGALRWPGLRRAAPAARDALLRRHALVALGFVPLALAQSVHLAALWGAPWAAPAGDAAAATPALLARPAWLLGLAGLVDLLARPRRRALGLALAASTAAGWVAGLPAAVVLLAPGIASVLGRLGRGPAARCGLGAAVAALVVWDALLARPDGAWLAATAQAITADAALPTAGLAWLVAVALLFVLVPAGGLALLGRLAGPRDPAGRAEPRRALPVSVALGLATALALLVLAAREARRLDAGARAERHRAAVWRLVSDPWLAFEGADRERRARARLAAAAHLAPDDPGLPLARAAVAAAWGDARAAFARLAPAARERPGDAALQWALAAAVDRGRLLRLQPLRIASVRRAVEADPAHLRAWTAWTQVAAGLGRAGEAAHALSRVRALAARAGPPSPARDAFVAGGVGEVAQALEALEGGGGR